MAEFEQISFPVRVVDGRIATVDPDSVQFAAEQVEVVCRTPRGWLPELPDFGLAEQRFRKGGADVGEVERQIRAWVPEAETAVSHDPTALQRGLDLIGVQVSV